MRTDITIPERMQSLQKDKRGYPIPFFVGYDDSGNPNFKYADVKKLGRCYTEKRCACCGKSLNKRMYFYVGGPFTIRNGVSTDGPMHKQCAEFAFQACPHIFYQKAERTAEATGTDKIFQMADKPEKMYIIQTADLMYKNRQGHPLFEFRPAKLWRYIYKDNKLVFDCEVKPKEEIELNEPACQKYMAEQMSIPNL